MKKRMRLALIASSIVIPGLLDRAVAQPVPALSTFVQVTGPASGYPQEHIALCYSKIEWKTLPQTPGNPVVGTSLGSPGTLTLQILDAGTGAEKAKKQIGLPVTTALPPDPCLEYVIPAAVTTSVIGFEVGAAAASPPVYIGVVSLNPQPLPPAAVISSLEVFTPGPNGIPTNIRHIPPAVTCPAGESPCVY